MDADITPELVSSFSSALKGDRSVVIARNATTSSGIKAAAKNPLPFRTYHDTYSVSLSPTGDVTAQKHSGRCWMFAGYNVMRDLAMSRLQTKNFELSQTYGQFWDKLEKANLFLERMIATADRPCDDRLVLYWLAEPISDGGWWEMVAAEAQKYGVVPKGAMPETAVSVNTAEMNEILARLLRQDAARLRAAAASGDDVAALRARKEAMLAEVYRVLAICLGEPPERFDLEYLADAAGDEAKRGEADAQKADEPAQTLAERKAAEATQKDFRRISGVTPHEFLRTYVGINFDEYVSLSNLPGETRPFGRILQMDDVIPTAGTPVRTLNEPIDVLKRAAIASLRDGHPVWFACDVLKNLYRNDGKGLLDTETVDTQSLFGVTYDVDKAERLDMRELQINHAMTLQGVNLDEQGDPIAWRVENSWGKDACKDGYLTITDRWMDENLGQVVVNRRYLPDDVAKAWYEPTEPPVSLDPWAPMIGCSD
ncbi:C1 family peptidase [bacterium]|nr:C1 family peptidase [bacterium]